MSDKYLQNILDSQNISDESQEMKALCERRDEVEILLHGKFAGIDLTIDTGGSMAKGTMNKESYDLDLICYFAHEDTTAGESLKEIYESVESALKEDYYIERKTSALRLHSRDPRDRVDFRVDVVPGRYVDGNDGDVFLHQTSGEKNWLKTNLSVHISHIRNSRVTDAIRLLKLWSVRNRLSVRTFVLELLTVEMLKQKKDSKLTDQLKHVWTKLRDEISRIAIEDPANPTGNDLSDKFNDSVKQELSLTAARTLELIDKEGWEMIFGKVSAEAASLIVPSFTVRPRGSFGE